jgi:hypothetical protein
MDRWLQIGTGARDGSNKRVTVANWTSGSTSWKENDMAYVVYIVSEIVMSKRP